MAKSDTYDSTEKRTKVTKTTNDRCCSVGLGTARAKNCSLLIISGMLAASSPKAAESSDRVNAGADWAAIEKCRRAVYTASDAKSVHQATGRPSRAAMLTGRYV